MSWQLRVDAAAAAVGRLTLVRLDAAPASCDSCAELLSADERDRAARFHFERDRVRYTVARASLRQLLAHELDVPATAITFEYGLHGKPALGGAQARSDLCFNISHSDDLALIAITRGRQVGVDIETLRTLPDEERLARRFFSRVELAEYLAESAALRNQAYFNCWTRKEAVVKALGHGLTFPLDAFEVTLAPSMPARLLRLRELAGDACGWCLEGFTPAPGFVAAVAVQGRYCDLCPVMPAHGQDSGYAGPFDT